MRIILFNMKKSQPILLHHHGMLRTLHFFSDIETTKANENKILLIKNLITNKEQLRVIIDNIRIENFITKTEKLLTEVIKVGHHIESYPEQTQKNKINNGINLSLGILRKKKTL